nr:carboxypeptidase-like regulatory domain-containing protein [Prolixibacteraceae bacterium]
MKIDFKASLVLSLMLILCSYLNAQTLSGKVYGSVIDKQSHTTLPGVNIVASVNGNNFGTVSDANGNFQFENIPVGRFDLEFSLVGYEKLSMQHVSLTSAKNLVFEAAMTEKVETVNEIVVKANKKDELINEFALISARTFTVEESNKYAGSWGDPARMASNFAGVVTAGDQRNDIIIRGNSPCGLLWRLDGITIPNPNHFGSMGTTGGPINMLNNNQLANSDFFTGAYPAEFGNALSGVFDLKMRNGNQHKHEFIGAMGFNGFEMGAEGPISRSK